MEFQTVFISVSLMIGLGAILATILAVANKKLYVFEDPRIDQVEGMLPNANCGACGEPGCRAFAEKVVKGDVSPGKCSVSAPEQREQIADVLGVSVGIEDKYVARLACAGGTHVARQRVLYHGLQSCRAANLVAGGGKGCAWGCLGLGDCEVVCNFDAIVMNEFGLPVVDEDLCTACGDCVEICPKDLFSLKPMNHQLFVACKSKAFGDDAEGECEVACTGCGKCALDAPESMIQIQNNLATIDYSKNDLATKHIVQRCPTGAIVWLEDGLAFKGKEAKKVIRSESLPIG